MDALTEATLRLVFTPGLGPRRIKLLIEAFGDAERVLEAAPPEWRQVEGIGPKIIGAMTAARTSDAPAKELERAERLKIRLLPLTHPDYPESLRQIFDPPSILYVRGTLPKAVLREPSQVRAVGVVGTREASDYALELSRTISRELAGAGVVIVSGLALGVDTTAHEGAVGVTGGETVAVLGSGVNVIYPRQNVRLAEKILSGHGAIVSEYRIGTEPQAKNFPGRNRIINGLSRGILVVEGGASSGAMITAEYALEEGRTVFAVPGRAGDARAVGTLGLLKQGAVLTPHSAGIR